MNSHSQSSQSREGKLIFNFQPGAYGDFSAVSRESGWLALPNLKFYF